ncbi:hypothetical protein PWT90_09490 [Aphanocladium album]|nr:hypothetical protein PWT90_09490 [Aphanocladium album]
MTAIREIPLGWMLLASFVGCALPKLLHIQLPETGYQPIVVLIAVFWTLFAGQTFLFALYATLIYPFFLSPFRHLPCPKGGTPFLGHGRELKVYGPGHMARQWYAEAKDDSLMRVLWHGNQEMIFIRSQQALAEVFVKSSYSFEKPDFIRGFLSVLIGWALLTTEGDEHKKQRRNMLPAFSFRHIKDLYPLFWQKSCEGVTAMTTEWQNEKNDATGYASMEISSWSARSGLDIIGLASSGIDFGAIKDADNPTAKSYWKLNPSPSDFLLIGLRAFLPQWLVMRLPLPRIRTVKKAASHIRGVCRDLIREKRRRVASKQSLGLDILSVAFQSGLFSDENLVDQMMTFLSAGHETTAASLVWAIYLMSKYPAMQERLRAEIRAKLPSPDSANADITSADIDGLPYLNAVCNEVLRTYSPVAATIRVANCDTVVQNTPIPKGTLFIVPIWAINTDPLHWGPNAHEFKPERWLSPEHGGTSKVNAASGGATSNYAFMTFIHGPHSCIGGNFSRSEMACLLAAWVGRFDFRIQDESLLDERNLKVNPSVVAKPEGGLHMLVKAIDAVLLASVESSLPHGNEGAMEEDIDAEVVEDAPNNQEQADEGHTTKEMDNAQEAEDEEAEETHNDDDEDDENDSGDEDNNDTDEQEDVGQSQYYGKQTADILRIVNR